jgi:hypothetical protein
MLKKKFTRLVSNGLHIPNARIYFQFNPLFLYSTTMDIIQIGLKINS